MKIFEWLQQVRDKPTMYIGWTDEERGKQLDTLAILIDGYTMALEVNDVKDDLRNFPQLFASHLRTRFGWEISAGAIAAIRHAYPDDNQAWEHFWELVAEFRGTVGPR